MYENLTDKKVIIDCGGWNFTVMENMGCYGDKSNSISISDGWTNRYKQIYHKSSQENRTLVGWNRKMESVKQGKFKISY